MNTPSSQKQFGHADFDRVRVRNRIEVACPVLACSATMVAVPFGKRKRRDGTDESRLLPWCPDHGIRIHSGTFVYWNGHDNQEDARLRNFIVRSDLVRTLALGKGMKVESHRLGYEMSEDALSWNVFVSLSIAGKLRQTAEFLTGRKLLTEPHLYLWGRRVDTVNGEHPAYEPLLRVRQELERGIAPFVTEPDISQTSCLSLRAKFSSASKPSSDQVTRLPTTALQRTVESLLHEPVFSRVTWVRTQANRPGGE